jgi:hypothetical protein
MGPQNQGTPVDALHDGNIFAIHPPAGTYNRYLLERSQ